VLRLRKDTAVESGVNVNVNERRSSEPFYVNIPSVGLKGRLHDDEPVPGDKKAKSRSVDNVVEDPTGSHESIELVIAEPDDSMQLSDSQKCNCCCILSLIIHCVLLYISLTNLTACF